MRIFVSYSRKDKEFVDQLYHSLTALGYSVWTDRRRTPGLTHDQWQLAVVEAIKASDVFVIVISPDSTASRSVERELTVAASKSKRLVPVIHRVSTVPGEFGYGGEVEFEGVFAFHLTGLEYVDFTKSSFEDDMDRLSTHLGPVADTPAYNITELVPAIANETAADHDNESESSPDKTGPEHETRTRDGIHWPTVGLIAGAVAAAAAIVGLGIALWPSDSERDEAISLVGEWADATTDRDFDAAAQIDASMSAAELEDFYDPGDGWRMFAMHPYIASARQDGRLWTLTGAAIAYDHDPSEVVRSSIICSEWAVDLERGKANWTREEAQFRSRQIPPDQFDVQYEANCR